MAGTPLCPAGFVPMGRAAGGPQGAGEEGGGGAGGDSSAAAITRAHALNTPRNPAWHASAQMKPRAQYSAFMRVARGRNSAR